MCWWIFHEWTRWKDDVMHRTFITGKDYAVEMQSRSCKVCNIKQVRYW